MLTADISLCYTTFIFKYTALFACIDTFRLQLLKNFVHVVLGLTVFISIYEITFEIGWCYQLSATFVLCHHCNVRDTINPAQSTAVVCLRHSCSAVIQLPVLSGSLTNSHHTLMLFDAVDLLNLFLLC